jgi:hypothetical protein
MREKILDMKRILKKGGIFMASISMPGSALDVFSEPSGDSLGTKIVNQGNQAGAKICIPNRSQLDDIFESLNGRFGTVEYDFEAFSMPQNSFWVACFTKSD